MNVHRIFAAMARLVTFLGTNAAQWAETEIREQWRGLKTLFLLSVLIPLASIVLGLIVGRIGYAADAGWCISVAEWSISVGGFVGALLVTLLWVKLVVYGKAIAAVSGGMNSITALVPELTQAAVDRFLALARGWTAWFAGIMIYVAVVPCYRNLTVTAIAGLAAIGLSATAVWFHGPWAQRALLAGLVTTLVVATVTLFVPGLMHGINTWTSGLGDSAAIRVDRTNELAAIDRTEEQSRTETQTQLAERFSKRRVEIERSMYGCNGQFCSDADRAEYDDLGQRLTWLRDGEYIERMAERSRRQAASTPAPTPPAQVQVVIPGGAAILSPPPILAGGTSSHGRRPHPAATPSPRGDDDFGMGGLDRYPDL